MAATRLIALHHVKTKTVAECLKRSITIMRIDVRTKALENANNGVKGVATVTFGNSFAVRNISIVESKAGNLFMSMPSYKTKTVDENGKAQFKDIMSFYSLFMTLVLFC